MAEKQETPVTSPEKTPETAPKKKTLTKFKCGDRVRRLETDGPFGTVQNIRAETVRQSIRLDESEPPGVTVTVLWDNGTKSHFIPEGLEAA